ncbi:MAG: hypothetical protein ACODAC_09340 [Pseudomonadota bacterium]
MLAFANWRVWLGLGLTAAWLLLGIFYISTNIGWGRFIYLPADRLGNFFEGAFAPLAFLWLVIGYFLQKKELEQNTQALRAQAEEIQRQSEQAVIQSEKLAASETHARQEVFLQIARNVRNQLGTIGGLLFLSSQGAAAGDGNVSPEQMSRLFARSAAQDPELFSRMLLEIHTRMETTHESQFELFYGTPVRARHSNNFIFTFERLMRKAEEVDPDFIIRDALAASSHGLCYRLAKRHQANAPADLADPARTGLHLHF